MLTIRPSTFNPQTVKFGHQPSSSQPDYTRDHAELNLLRNELVERIPGGRAMKYHNSDGIGLINYPDDRRIGVVFGFETQKNLDKVVQHLLENNVIQPNADGTYRYNNALVGFKLNGRISIH